LGFPPRPARRVTVPRSVAYFLIQATLETRKENVQYCTMYRDAVIAMLRAHEPELRASGVISLSVFGSVARGEERPVSDLDVMVRLTEDPSWDGFAYFGRINALTHRLRDIVCRPVDVVIEPVRKDRLRRVIEKEGARAF
jgi:predicted nucleotidyltransferase